MQDRKLGATPIAVSPIGLGCWQFSDGVGIAGRNWPTLADVAFREIIQASIAGGVNWFDTAELYGWGASERALSEGLQAAGAAPDSVRIATKWHPWGRPVSSLLRTIDARKECLAPYPIDLHQIHAPTAFGTINQEAEALARLLDDGHIRAAGVSNYGAGQMRRMHAALEKRGHVLASNQVEYSLLKRRIERNGVLEAAKELGVTIIAWSPLAQGLLTGKYHADPGLAQRSVGWRKYLPKFRKRGLAKSAPVIAEIERIAEKHGKSAGQVALNWLLHAHGDTVVAIPGATKLSQAENNVGAMTFQISDAEIARLNEVSKPYL